MIITPLKDRVEETTWTIVALGSTSIFFLVLLLRH